jgi:hypothetical protein
MEAAHHRPQEYPLIKRLAPLAALVLSLIAAGCGSTTEISQTSQPVVTTTKTVTTQTHRHHTRRIYATTAFTRCDGYVQVGPSTSCAFANNVFYEFFESQPDRAFTAYSPTTGQVYDMSCGGGSVITCSGGLGAKVRFPMSAVDIYTERDAVAYATTHDLGPDDTAAAAPAESASFCSSHDCIDNFDNGTGYIVECVDGEWSHSGGRPGACSYHGGETDVTYP